MRSMNWPGGLRLISPNETANAIALVAVAGDPEAAHARLEELRTERRTAEAELAETRALIKKRERALADGKAKLAAERTQFDADRAKLEHGECVLAARIQDDAVQLAAQTTVLAEKERLLEQREQAHAAAVAKLAAERLQLENENALIEKTAFEIRDGLR